MSHNDEFISLINSVFTDKTRSIQDLTVGANFEQVMKEDFNSYFAANLLKKASGLDLGIDPDESAILAFNTFLDNQEDVNFKVQSVLDNIHLYPTLGRVLENVKKLMSKFFAPWHVVAMQPRFTSGSTLTLRKGASVFSRVRASEGQKVLRSNFQKLYNNVEGMTGNYADPLLDRIPHTVGTADWYISIITVSKTWDMSRIVGLGPSSALAHQCGLADWITYRLKVFCGIDLSTAPDVHKELAKDNSLDGEFSTQDQRHASDNILKCLVNYVAPNGVYDYMNAITPDILDIQGIRRQTHMLCPAGNGFNTPFQTLLFWCLITGIQMEIGVKHKVYVYGDDVIVHRNTYDSVCKVFPLLGLEINQSKSFKEGPFRESCGGDFLYGINIRPFYAKTVPQSTIDWIKFCNGVRRVGYYNSHSTWRSTQLRSLWFRSILHIPKDERLFCPRHYGDAGINTECESLYDLLEAPRWDRERTHQYPNNGYDCNGNPYGAERIRIYVSTTGGSKTTFAEESRNLPANLVLRTISSPFVVGSGSKRKAKQLPYKEGEPDPKNSYYPAVYGGEFDEYVPTAVAYSSFGQAPVDINDLFEHISAGNGRRISNREEVLQRLYLKEMISLLKARVAKMERDQHHAALTQEAHEAAVGLHLSF